MKFEKIGRDNQKALAIITGGRRSHRRLLLDQFAAKYGAPAPVVYELFSDDLLRRANEMSFGVAQWSASIDSPTELIDPADQALYLSKQNGRNRVSTLPA